MPQFATGAGFTEQTTASRAPRRPPASIRAPHPDTLRYADFFPRNLSGGNLVGRSRRGWRHCPDAEASANTSARYRSLIELWPLSERDQRSIRKKSSKNRLFLTIPSGHL